MLLALFAVAPIVCSCLLSLVYTLYLFMAYEESGVHHAQEFENRFWTIFALLFSTALFFAQDSPLAFGRYSPSLGFFAVLVSSYVMHLYDRYMHRIAISQQTKLIRRTISNNQMAVTLEEHLVQINNALMDIDQLLIPSTINNFINQRFVFKKEKEIIDVFKQCDATVLNYLISHVKLGLLIYKIKDHRNFAGQHRTELIQLLAVDRLPALTAYSRVIVLHALQILKLRANPRAEYWVKNILLNSHGDDLSEIKTLTDAKGDYFCMNKLIFDDIRSETVRQDILNHIRKEGALQLSHMQLGTKRAQQRQHMAWRKVLSDVDDTLLSSGGHYPAGIDKRYPRKVVYPGVLAFYRELDLGTSGPEEWPENRVGNLVFLSARPHVYKDMSEKSNFKKFEKLRMVNDSGRTGMHTTPSLLPGDLASGTKYMATNDFEPLARKKFDNFKRYVSIYPEYQHVFVCDNGQGDVKAGEMMFDSFPYEFEATYIHIVQDRQKTFGYAPERWKEKEWDPCFFRTYPEAAIHAATRCPPLIRLGGLRRVCLDAVNDFYSIPAKQWQSELQKAERRAELNQSVWEANKCLESNYLSPVELVKATQQWKDGEKVKTPYGIGKVRGFDPESDLYDIELDWRPLDVQVNEHLLNVKEEAVRPRNKGLEKRASAPLETVVEADEVTDDEDDIALLDLRRSRSTVDNDATNENRVKAAMSPKRDTSWQEAFSPRLDHDTLHTSSDTASVTSKSTDNSSEDGLSAATPEHVEEAQDSKEKAPVKPGFAVKAKIGGRFISKYVPPSLPAIDKKNSPLFSFWTGAPKEPKAVVFQKGEKCSTPYGPATVVEHRVPQRIVLVEMIGWKANAYLQEATVKVSKEGLLSSLFRRQHIVPEATPSQPIFPYAKGTEIQTPYGSAEVVEPLRMQNKKGGDKSQITNEETLCLSLKSWKLADGSSPKLYCTVQTATEWMESADHKNPKDGILSAFGTFMSTTLDFAGRFSSQKPKEGDAAIPRFERYYSDAAAVSTQFGNGRVLGFRDTDGFYCVSLESWGWKASGQKNPKAWLREVDINYQIARGCQEGYPVLTNLGVTGILESVQPDTGIHIVTVPSAGMVMYLQPNAIIRPLKAAVGEDALTAYGEGRVEKYDAENNTYVIRLSGWGARLFAKAETFDRVRDSMRDKDGPFGMKWLLEIFFSSSKQEEAEGTRSRSNSVASGSVRSRSRRSSLT